MRSLVLKLGCNIEKSGKIIFPNLDKRCCFDGNNICRMNIIVGFKVWKEKLKNWDEEIVKFRKSECQKKIKKL